MMINHLLYEFRHPIASSIAFFILSLPQVNTLVEDHIASGKLKSVIIRTVLFFTLYYLALKFIIEPKEIEHEMYDANKQLI